MDYNKEFAIKITNLCDNAQDLDLEELVRPFGTVTKLFVAQDKITGMCKGYAYVYFSTKEEATKAIAALNGHKLDLLILNVQWLKRQPEPNLQQWCGGNPSATSQLGRQTRVAPCLRDGGNKRGETMDYNKDFAIKITNLSDNAQDIDVKELVDPFGTVTKLFVAQDKITRMCMGYAYVYFSTKEEAAKAIAALNGHSYDHLILNVAWLRRTVAPCLRDGGNKRGETMNHNRDFVIKITNLSDNTQDQDLGELVKPFGNWTKIFVAKDKITGMGFAYVHFRTKEEAAKAIAGLNGHGYDHLILNVEWSKPQPQS